MLQVLFFVFAFLVAAELALHIIYFAFTGRAGLNDPPFDYLLDLFSRKRKKNNSERRK